MTSLGRVLSAFSWSLFLLCCDLFVQARVSGVNLNQLEMTPRMIFPPCVAYVYICVWGLYQFQCNVTLCFVMCAMFVNGKLSDDYHER